MSGPTSTDMLCNTHIQVDGAVKKEARPFWLPEELICKIFSFLDYNDLDSCCLVCRQWRRVAQDEEVRIDSYLRMRTFGGEHWAAYYGDIGEKTPLPLDIRPFLKSPSPFWLRQSVARTTRLVWMPKQINGIPFTLNTWSERVQQPLKGFATRFKYYDPTVQVEYGTSAKASCWLLITEAVIPRSRGKWHVEQQELIERHAGYTLPEALEVTTCMVTTFVMSGKYLYGQNPMTYTQCNEKLLGRYPVVVGDFGPDGLVVNYSCIDFGSEKSGAAALWKL